ncbi:hypothetical protein WMF39_01530 [Sorangium sp. So ce1504]|uniref:hypothetical protein n=1 Tax=Sorangium sp. So ce1504 TaxID=3133337 RepID=UPI003F63413C
MFRNLAQTEDAAVLVSVGTFVERWEKLARSKEKGGPDAQGDEARKMLTKRGLTKTVVDEAKELLARAGRLEPTAEDPPATATDEDFDTAEQELWDWYLEWSTIVQTAIKDRRLLRELGFRRASASRAAPASEDANEESNDDSDTDADTTQAEPGAFLTGAPVPKAKTGAPTANAKTGAPTAKAKRKER